MNPTVRPIYNDVDISRALNAYLRTGGDYSQTYKLLRSQISDEENVPTVATMRNWGQRFKWDLTLANIRERLQVEAAQHALASLRRDIGYLEVAKSRLMEEIAGKYDAEGNCTSPPVSAKTLESAATALVRVLEAQTLMRGEALGKEKAHAESSILELLRVYMTDGNTDDSSNDDAPTGTSLERVDPEGPPTDG